MKKKYRRGKELNLKLMKIKMNNKVYLNYAIDSLADALSDTIHNNGLILSTKTKSSEATLWTDKLHCSSSLINLPEEAKT